MHTHTFILYIYFHCPNQSTKPTQIPLTQETRSLSIYTFNTPLTPQNRNYPQAEELAAVLVEEARPAVRVVSSNAELEAEVCIYNV